jgi:uncharacterized membrane protein
LKKGGIHVREDVTASSYQRSTGSFDSSLTDYENESEDAGVLYRVGQAAMILSGVALVALAAKRATSGHRLLPESLTQRASDAVAPVPVEAALTIGKPASELYAFWRRLENLPQFMNGLEEVTELDDRRSHWVGKSPLGFKAEWDAEIVEEREGQFLSWRSLPDSPIHNAGTVFFDEMSPRGTVVRVSMEIGSASTVGQAVGKVVASGTERQVLEDLRRFKRLMETGEIATTEGQSHGTRSFIGAHVHNPF